MHKYLEHKLFSIKVKHNNTKIITTIITITIFFTIIIVINELWEKQIWALPVEVLQSYQSRLSRGPGSEAPDILSSDGKSEVIPGPHRPTEVKIKNMSSQS